jgi:hypothetical protein
LALLRVSKTADPVTAKIRPVPIPIDVNITKAAPKLSPRLVDAPADCRPMQGAGSSVIISLFCIYSMSIDYGGLKLCSVSLIFSM